jgi:hypothetical protein
MEEFVGFLQSPKNRTCLVVHRVARVWRMLKDDDNQSVIIFWRGSSLEWNISHSLSFLQWVSVLKGIYEKSGVYWTRSVYRNRMFRGVVNKRMIKLLKNKAPMKIRVYMWMLIQYKLQTRVNLNKKKWKGDRNCCLCGVPKTNEHILFNSIVAKTIWMCFKEALGWDKCLTHIKEVFDRWIAFHSHNYHIKLFIYLL